ncbi:fatty acid desaturase family protein [Pseudohalioglobus sediminis]|nr:fatty acid desaturase [Pseudohalioglobus sediminis]
MTIRFADLPAEFKQVDDAWAWRQLLRCWLTIGAAIWLCGLSDNPLVWLLAFVVVGHMQYHLSVLGHHGLHRNLFSSQRVNEFVSRYLLHGPLGLPNEAMRRNHMTHHRYFEQEQDYERENYDFSLFGRDTPRGLLRWLIGAYTGGAVLPAVGRVLRGSGKQAKKDASGGEGAPGAMLWSTLRDWLPVMVSQLVLVCLWWWGTGHWWAYSLWFVAIFTLLAGFSATRAMLEHADPAEPPQRLMSFPCSAWQRYLLGAANFNFHAEHHLYGGVPACHLERLHHYLRERDALPGVVLVPSYTERLGQLLSQLRLSSAEGGAR